MPDNADATGRKPSGWRDVVIGLVLLGLTLLLVLFFLRNVVRSECGLLGGQPPFCGAASSVSNAPGP